MRVSDLAWRRQPPAFAALEMLDVDVDLLPMARQLSSGPDGTAYERAQVLLRRDGRPVGVQVVHAVDGVVHIDQPPEDPASAPVPPVPVRGPWVTVLIGTRDRPESLRRCLASLRRLDYHPFDVVVVDNALRGRETWREVMRAREAGLDITYVREPIAGLSTAHNAGLKVGGAELVAITDDDVEVDPAWLGALVATFEAHPDAAAVTGLIYPAALDHPAQARAEGSQLGKGFAVRRFDMGAHQPEDPLFPWSVGACGSGANMAVRRHVLQQLGGFDLALGVGSPAAGGDDLALFHDLLVRGHAVVYQPAALVRHHHPAQDAALMRQAYGYGKGLGAYLARCAITEPHQVLGLLRNVPRGAARLVRNESHTAEGTGMRRGHGLRHLRGLLAGPGGYVRSRRRASRIRIHVGSMVGHAETPGAELGRDV